MHHLLCRQCPLCFDEEVTSEEGNTDDDAISNKATANDGDKDMPPKTKPTAATMAAVAKKKPPATKKGSRDASPHPHEEQELLD